MSRLGGKKIIPAGMALIALAVLPLGATRYMIYIITLILIYAVGAQGLNFLIGYTGQISLGHGAFMAIGAYGTAIICQTYGFSFWLALILVPFGTGMVGVLIALPALRLKGLYLAMVTLAFHMVVALGLMSLDSITGGFQGIDVPPPHLGNLLLKREVHFYYLALIMASVFFLMSVNLSRSKVYRAFISIKVRETSTQSMGISIWHYKTLAFFLASVYAGMAGCLFAVTMGHITPNHFPLMVSIEYIMMNIVGGVGSIAGILMGSILITTLPYLLLAVLQAVSTVYPMAVINFADIKLIIYGVIIVFFLMFVPGGFQGLILKLTSYFKVRRQAA